MLVTLILIGSLLSGGAVLVSMQVASTKGAQVTRSKLTAVHCAEAGLVTARATVATNYKLWNAALLAGTEPSWLASLPHDLDGDSVSDYTITLRDNDDETTNNLTRDNDLSVYIVSTCTKFPETPAQVAELVRYNAGGNCYQAQLGGCGGNSNAN